MYSLDSGVEVEKRRKMVEGKVKVKEKEGRASVEKVLSCFGVRVDKRTVSDDNNPCFLVFAGQLRKTLPAPLWLATLLILLQGTRICNLGTVVHVLTAADPLTLLMSLQHLHRLVKIIYGAVDEPFLCQVHHATL